MPGGGLLHGKICYSASELHHERPDQHCCASPGRTRLLPDSPTGNTRRHSPHTERRWSDTHFVPLCNQCKVSMLVRTIQYIKGISHQMSPPSCPKWVQIQWPFAAFCSRASSQQQQTRVYTACIYVLEISAPIENTNRTMYGVACVSFKYTIQNPSHTWVGVPRARVRKEGYAQSGHPWHICWVDNIIRSSTVFFFVYKWSYAQRPARQRATYPPIHPDVPYIKTYSVNNYAHHTPEACMSSNAVERIVLIMFRRPAIRRPAKTCWTCVCTTMTPVTPVKMIILQT